MIINPSKIIGALSLALPVVQFFCTSHLFIEAILLLLSFLCFFLLAISGYLNNEKQEKRVLLPSIILILLIITGFFFSAVAAFSLSKYLGLSALFLFFITTNNNFFNLFISKGVFIIVTFEIILYLISLPIPTVFFYPNNSILSILLSCQFAFLAPVTISLIQNCISKKTNRLLLLFSIVFFCYLILFLSSGRAGFISFSITLFILNINYFRKISLSRKIIMILFAFVLLCSLYFIKANSSNGRTLIYKVILTSINQIQLFTGIGYGQFKAQYNHYQSDYFSKHPIDNSEALLADNTYYAFNDPFQLILELGIIGISVLLIFIKTLGKKLKSDLPNGLQENSILYGAYLCIFSFLTSSLLSYPFQVISILPLFLLSLAIVFGSNRQESKSVNDTIKPIFQWAKFLLYLVFSIFLLFLGYKYLNIHYKMKEAENLSKAGLKRKSVAIYSDLSNDMIVDGSIYYPFAMELAKLNKTDSAIIVLEKSIKYIYNDHSALLLANLYFDNGQLQLADRFYREAVLINPKSFSNRFALFIFYVNTKQKDKSLYWGRSIIELVPKIPSETVTSIKYQTANILQKIQ